MGSDPGFGVASEVIRIVVEPNTFVIIGGTALGAYTQRLTVLREADEWQLIGLDKVLIYDRTSYLSFGPVSETVAYILLFESSSQGGEFEESEYGRDFKSTKHVVPNFATYYTCMVPQLPYSQIHTKDGGDNDLHNITLSVALIGATKGRTGSNCAEPGGSDESESILEPCACCDMSHPLHIASRSESPVVCVILSQVKLSPNYPRHYPCGWTEYGYRWMELKAFNIGGKGWKQRQQMYVPALVNQIRARLGRKRERGRRIMLPINVAATPDSPPESTWWSRLESSRVELVARLRPTPESNEVDSPRLRVDLSHFQWDAYFHDFLAA
ncbi:hypothetical protein C8R44DRAFT_737139 [Mycena epipterygia]|nr:hypothetical protein C8R44DRAFT_737139 [Mycena epipterygia]